MAEEKRMKDFMHIDMGNGSYVAVNGGSIGTCDIPMFVPRKGDIIVTSGGFRRRVKEISIEYKNDGNTKIDISTEDL